MTRCPNCGKELAFPDRQRICGHCGAALLPVDPVARVSAARPPPADMTQVLRRYEGAVIGINYRSPARVDVWHHDPAMEALLARLEREPGLEIDPSLRM